MVLVSNNNPSLNTWLKERWTEACSASWNHYRRLHDPAGKSKQTSQNPGPQQCQQNDTCIYQPPLNQTTEICNIPQVKKRVGKSQRLHFQEDSDRKCLEFLFSNVDFYNSKSWFILFFYRSKLLWLPSQHPSHNSL